MEVQVFSAAPKQQKQMESNLHFFIRALIFSKRGLYLMIQFYDEYVDNEKMRALIAQFSWTNNLLILRGAKQKCQNNNSFSFLHLYKVKNRYKI